MLEAKNPDLRERFAQPFATLAETQAGLPAGALLVEYYTVGVLPRGDALINKLPAENARVRAHLALPPQTLIVLVGRDTLEVRNAPLDPNRLRPASGEPLPTQRLLEPALLDQRSKEQSHACVHMKIRIREMPPPSVTEAGDSGHKKMPACVNRRAWTEQG